MCVFLGNFVHVGGEEQIQKDFKKKKVKEMK